MLCEEMGIVVGSTLSPRPLEPLFDFWFEDEHTRNWGRLLKVRFEGTLDDLTLQPEEVESARWMNVPELRRLMETGPVSPDAAVACQKWLANSDQKD